MVLVLGGEHFETETHLGEDPRGVQCSEGGGERLQVRGSLMELTLGRGKVTAINVQEADGDLDQGVVKEPEGIGGLAPEVLQRLVGVPVAAGSKEIEAGMEFAGEAAVVRVRGAAAPEAFEPEGVLLRPRRGHGATN